MRRTKLVDVRLEPNKGNRAQVMCWGDLHIGAKTCDFEAASEAIQRCLDKGIYVLGMGDMLECATRYSVGAGIYEQTQTLEQQIEMTIELLESVVERGLFLGMHLGNHEERVNKEVGLNIMKIMCQRLGCRYLNHAAYHLWRVGKESYTVHSTHGSAGSRLPYTKIKSALDVFRYVDTEIVCYGHLHGLDHMTSLYSAVNKSRKKVESRSRHAILTGSYLRYSGSYAEKKNLAPVQMGSPIISLYRDDHRIHVSL